MNSESKPSSSTRRAKALIPRARSGPSPSQTYDGRNTPNRPTSVMDDRPSPPKPPSSAVVVRIALGEERRHALDEVLAGEQPVRGVELGGEARLEVRSRGQVEETL